jgi:hypothetical protein
MPALSLALWVLLAGAPPPGPPKPTRLKIDVKPEVAVVYLDGVKKGTGAKSILVTVTPGRHKLKVTNKGDSVEDYVVVKKGETTNWQWVFEDDHPPPKPAAEDTPAPESP